MNGPVVKRPFRDDVDDPPSCPHEILLLKSIIHTLPVSTADCDRGFSTMNVIATKCINRLLVETVTNLLFLSLLGSPQSTGQERSVTVVMANDMRMFGEFC